MEEKDNKLNVDVWGKKMVETMFMFFRTLWKERCEINQAQKAGTMDSRLRETTYHYCRQIQKEIWKLHSRDRHLIRQPKHFFQNRNIQQILAWEKRVHSALRREREAMKIMKQSPHMVIQPGPRLGSRITNTTIVNTVKRLKQTILPFSPTFRTSTSADGDTNIPTRTRRSMNARQRRDQRNQERNVRQTDRVRNASRVVQGLLTEWVTRLRRDPTENSNHSDIENNAGVERFDNTTCTAVDTTENEMNIFDPVEYNTCILHSTNESDSMSHTDDFNESYSKLPWS